MVLKRYILLFSFMGQKVQTNGYARAKGQAEEYEDMNCFMRGVTKVPRHERSGCCHG